MNHSTSEEEETRYEVYIKNVQSNDEEELTFSRGKNTSGIMSRLVIPRRLSFQIHPDNLDNS